jgi:omega-3 fatty acid desaturase (delta-15 desaturase)
VLLVPYYPWARSHHQHHSFHNCKEDDRSHPWLTPAELATWPRFMRAALPTLLGPLLGFWAYLFYGMSPDGSHIVCFGELYRGAAWRERVESVVSTAAVAVWAYAVFVFVGASLYTWWAAYGGVIAVCYVWLFMVTWFQHHDEDTRVYPREHWSFVKGGLETIDRKVGYSLDFWHHHITDGHIAHHFFFRQIPHYRLREATAALYKYAREHASPQLKMVDHSAYPLKFVVDFARAYPKLNMLHWTLAH